MEFDQLLRSLKDNPDEVEFNDVMELIEFKNTVL